MSSIETTMKFTLNDRIQKIRPNAANQKLRNDKSLNLDSYGCQTLLHFRNHSL
jgi:hypothetical protein